MQQGHQQLIEKVAVCGLNLGNSAMGHWCMDAIESALAKNPSLLKGNVKRDLLLRTLEDLQSGYQRHSGSAYPPFITPGTPGKEDLTSKADQLNQKLFKILGGSPEDLDSYENVVKQLLIVLKDPNAPIKSRMGAAFHLYGMGVKDPEYIKLANELFPKVEHYFSPISRSRRIESSYTSSGYQSFLATLYKQSELESPPTAYFSYKGPTRSSSAGLFEKFLSCFTRRNK